MGKNPLFKWILDGHELEQVSLFKYLGIHLNGNLSWAQQINATTLTSARALGQLKSFFYNRGGQLIIPAIKIFVAKNLPQMLYGVELWRETGKLKLETIKNKFMKQILGSPRHAGPASQGGIGSTISGCQNQLELS